MLIIICILLAVAVISTLKALNYFYALCGVLHYLIEKYGDELNETEIKELAVKAAKNI